MGNNFNFEYKMKSFFIKNIFKIKMVRFFRQKLQVSLKEMRIYNFNMHGIFVEFINIIFCNKIFIIFSLLNRLIDFFIFLKVCLIYIYILVFSFLLLFLLYKPMSRNR